MNDALSSFTCDGILTCYPTIINNMISTPLDCNMNFLYFMNGSSEACYLDSIPATDRPWTRRNWLKTSYDHQLYNITPHQSVQQKENTAFRAFRQFNSLWPSDTIWRHKSGSTLDQVMACCLTAPSHYLNQC